ncbi:MAG: hypothetical protein E7616_03470 [Ruminococcaceae bacterium]|nr:hypothetical protein [Oscillospiraceae bacterium]
MKRMFCILLCIGMLVPLAACSGTGSAQNEKKTVDDFPPFYDPLADLKVLELTVTDENDGYTSFSKPEMRTYYAYNEKGEYYRILCRTIGDVKEGDTIFVAYSKNSDITQLNYDPNATGFFAKYKVEAHSAWTQKALDLRKIAGQRLIEEYDAPLSHLQCNYVYEDGIYEFTYKLYLSGYDVDTELIVRFSEDGEIKKTHAKNPTHMAFAGTKVEASIPDTIAHMNEDAGMDLAYYKFYVDSKGYLCIQSEAIKSIDPADPEYGKVGCLDHKHITYDERVGKLPK